MFLLMSDNTFKVKAGKVWGSVKNYCKIKKAVFGLRKGQVRVLCKKILKSKDLEALYKGAFTILMDGFMISGLLYYFIGFSFPLAIAFGAGYWWIKKDALVELRKLLSTINFIKIGK